MLVGFLLRFSRFADLDPQTIALLTATIVGAFGEVAVLMGWVKRKPKLRIHGVRLLQTSNPALGRVTSWIEFKVTNGWKRARRWFSYATNITASISIYRSDNKQKVDQANSGVLWGQTLYPGEDTVLRQQLMATLANLPHDVSVILKCDETGEGSAHHFKKV